MRPPDRVDVTVDDLLAPAPLLAHETGSFEHGDVFLNRREAHRVVLTQHRHRRTGSQGPLEDVATGRVGEGVEDHVRRFVLSVSYNHMVV